MYESNFQPKYDLFMSPAEEREDDARQAELIEELLETELSPYNFDNWDEMSDALYYKSKQMQALLAQGDKLSMADLGQFIFDTVKERLESAARYKINR